MTVPPNVLAMMREVAGLVLDDWLLERGSVFGQVVRAETVTALSRSMERAARSTPSAMAPLAAMSPDALRRHVRAWAEPTLLRALTDVHDRLAVIG